MANAIVSFEGEDKVACLKHLENITTNLREMLRIFYERLIDSSISRKVWLSYIQGFQGWGVGRMINGEFVKFDGLSGNHVLVFQAIDAFLGLDRYLTDENMTRYIPVNQRTLCLSLKKHCIRNRLKAGEDSKIQEEITKIVNHLKVSARGSSSNQRC
jgi:hypothetical protein